MKEYKASGYTVYLLVNVHLRPLYAISLRLRHFHPKKDQHKANTEIGIHKGETTPKTAETANTKLKQSKPKKTSNLWNLEHKKRSYQQRA